MAYSREVREAVLDKLFHSGLSSHQVAEETGVPRATIYGWKKRYMIKKENSTAINAQAENWSAEEKFAAVLHTATLSEVELNCPMARPYHTTNADGERFSLGRK